MKLRRLSTAAAGFQAKLAALTRYDAAQDPKVQKAVRAILADVRKNGDAAVRKYSKKFDGVLPGEIAVAEENLKSIEKEKADALRAAHERIRVFHEKQLQRSWEFTDGDGTRLGQQVTPLERVGLYVPGGKAAYPSSVLMNAVPAKVAGVRELVMASPNPDPLVLAAAALAGVDRVLRLGGAQAIAAFAYGTKSIARVDKIVGPGNAYVAEAKRQVFGEVGIDMVAGPSEILVIADESANADWVAMDLFSQAEHDESAQAISSWCAPAATATWPTPKDACACCARRRPSPSSRTPTWSPSTTWGPSAAACSSPWSSSRGTRSATGCSRRRGAAGRRFWPCTRRRGAGWRPRIARAWSTATSSPTM